MRLLSVTRMNRNRIVLLTGILGIVLSLTACMPPRPGDKQGVSQITKTPASVRSTVNKPSATQVPHSYTVDYAIGPEDVLEILVWKNTDLSKVVTVRPDGMISLPLIGEIRVAGRTAATLREVIRERLGEYQKTPEVSVIVQEVNSYNIYILGEVASPGKYQLKSHVTLLQAISLAGGFTPFSSRNKIKVLRKAYEEARAQTFKIRYKDILNGDTSKDILLMSGDTIIIP